MILLGDGVYDKLSNKDITIITLETLLDAINKDENFDKLLLNIENNILKEAIDRDSRDNISCIFICFQNFFEIFKKKEINKIKIAIEKLRNTSNELDSLYDELLNKYFLNNTNLEEKNEKLIKMEKPKEQFPSGNMIDNNKITNKNSKTKFYDYFCMCLGLKRDKRK